MKNALLVMVASGLAATWLGCNGAANSPPGSNSNSEKSAASGTLVSLKVPNMT